MELRAEKAGAQLLFLLLLWNMLFVNGRMKVAVTSLFLRDALGQPDRAFQLELAFESCHDLIAAYHRLKVDSPVNVSPI